MFLSIIDPCRERPINLLPRTLSYSPRGPSRRDPGDEVERPILETREFWKRILRLDWTENNMKHTLSLVFDVSLEDHWEFACLALIAFVFRSLQAVMTYKYCHLYSHF